MDPAITFIDLAGFTALTEAHGDDHAADLIDRYVDLVPRQATFGVSPTGTWGMPVDLSLTCRT